MMLQEPYVVLILFVVTWLATFIPCWFLLARLLALSIAERITPMFWVYFIVYRLLILFPYAVLLIFGRETVPEVVQAIIVGIVVTGFLLSLVRLLLRQEVVKILWWVYGFTYDGLLHFVPYTRLVKEVVTTAYQATPSPASILELGSGTGNVVKALEERFPQARLTAVDNSTSMLRIAKKKTTRTQHVHADIIDFLRGNQTTYDLVVMQNSLYAVADRAELWRQLSKVLAPGGAIVITNSDTPGSGTIVKEHLAHGGGRLNLIRPRLLAVGIIDNFISQLSQSGTFSFLKTEQLQAETEAYFKMSDVRRVYGGVNILFVLRCKEEGVVA